MRFSISSEDSIGERKLKEELNRLFSLEEDELRELAEPYFSIVERGGIVYARLNYPEGCYVYEYPSDVVFSIEKVERLIKKEVIGRSDRTFGHRYDFFLFDNFDAKFNDAVKHPMGIETYYELKYEAGHSDENIPILLKEVLSKYDKLQKVFRKGTPRSKILATSIALTCRGKYQCPVNMSRYFRLAGGPSAVNAAGEKIGEGLRYDPDARVRAYIPKLGLKGKSLRKFRELWRKEKGKVAVTPAYIGGLAYLAAKLSGDPITQRDAAERVGATETGVRNRVREIGIRQGIIQLKGRYAAEDDIKSIEKYLKSNPNVPFAAKDLVREIPSLKGVRYLSLVHRLAEYSRKPENNIVSISFSSGPKLYMYSEECSKVLGELHTWRNYQCSEYFREKCPLEKCPLDKLKGPFGER